MTGAALTISDDKNIVDKMVTVFEFIGCEVALADSVKSIKEEIDKDRNFLIALISLSNEDEQKKVISLLNKDVPSLPIYVLSEESEPDKQASVAKGVTGNLKFPIQYRELLGRIRQAELERKSSRSSNAFSTTLTGNSPEIKKIEALIRHVSMTDANVLLLGESGTGKEVVARGIHHLSLRTDRPFVAVNCGAIPPELLESELFGHEKGAFTGAISTRKGRFELAEGGTLFLDEIGDMPMPMQVKLLRVIQERTFERVGGTKIITSNVRLIAATHQDLEKRIGEGEFRMDLFYRLNVFPIELPPVRDRVSDIPLLIKKFSVRMELEHRSPIEFDESAIEALSQNPLPGNVRELENLVERLAILYPGETIGNTQLPQRYQLQQAGIQDPPGESLSSPANHLALSPLNTDEDIDLKSYLAALEKSIIYEALEKADWIVAKAAKSLSLQRTTLIQKIRKLDIKQSDYNQLALL